MTSMPDLILKARYYPELEFVAEYLIYMTSTTERRHVDDWRIERTLHGFTATRFLSTRQFQNAFELYEFATNCALKAYVDQAETFRNDVLNQGAEQ